jgi:hypothetical protein
MQSVSQRSTSDLGILLKVICDRHAQLVDSGYHTYLIMKPPILLGGMEVPTVRPAISLLRLDRKCSSATFWELARYRAIREEESVI